LKVGLVIVAVTNGTYIEYENVCDPFVGHALSRTVTVNVYGCGRASEGEGVQENVPTGLGTPATLKVAPATPLFHVIITVSAAFASAEFTVNDNGLPGQATVEKTPVPLIPEAEGRKFKLQVVVRNCISRITLPIRTPFLYSLIKIAATPISLLLVGVMLISPVVEFRLTAGEDVNGLLAE
jgi:hypothetical protein